jgi:hypothetical protein
VIADGTGVVSRGHRDCREWTPRSADVLIPVVGLPLRLSRVANSACLGGQLGLSGWLARVA